MMRLKKIIISLACIMVLVLAYHYSPYKIEHIGEREKIWAYRVTTMENLDFVQQHYHGLEIDLMYNAEQNQVQISHPDVDCPPMNLNSFLNEIDTQKINGIWFDLKNLTLSNATEFSKQLKKHTQKFDFKKIVESPNIEALAFFNTEEFETSYYLPRNFYPNSENFESTLKIIHDNLNQLKVNYISAEMDKYSLIKEHFPEQKLLFWSKRGTFHFKYFKESYHRQQILNDTKVEILLVRIDFNSGC
ncbi:MAG: hypothetical protein ABR595_06065 [Psychroflexus sp.]